jgi:hypothetical protein
VSNHSLNIRPFDTENFWVEFSMTIYGEDIDENIDPKTYGEFFIYNNYDALKLTNCSDPKINVSFIIKT